MNPTRLLIAVAMIVALSGWALAHDNENDSSVRRHGYRHGYVDGFHHGQEDRGERESYDFHSEDFSRADRGYRSEMGDKDDFQDGYRRGYREGYDDGYYNRPSRMDVDDDYRGYWNDQGGRDYNDGADGRDAGDYDRGSSRIPNISNDPKWTRMDPKSIGYRAGVEVGLDDWMNHRSFNPKESHRYHDADEWYEQASTHQDWTSQFRHGFVAGYQDAYNGAQWHNFGGQDNFGSAFRLGMLYGFQDTNRGKPYNPTRIAAYREHSSDPQYQDGFTKGYEWVFRLRQQR